MASNNVCHGCLSVDRQLVIIDEHAKLYNRLLLKKSGYTFKKLMMCWECHQILKNIQTFRMKITQAQKLLSNRSLTQRNSLSNLIVSKKINEYQLIIYEDETINTTQPTEIELPAIKQEDFDNLHTEVEVEVKFDDIYDIKTNAIKEEVKDESDADEFDADDKDCITELDEVLVPIDLLEKKNDIKVQLGRRKRGKLEQKYRTVVMDDIPDKRNFYDIVKIDKETELQWLEKRKKLTSTKKFQCKLCYAGFSLEKFYDRHLVLLHSQKNKLECDLCGCRFKDRRWLIRHMNDHFVQYVCKICGEQYRARNQIYVHLIHGPHVKQLECKLCRARFDCNKARDFFSHYRTTHGQPQCDHCGLRCTSKGKLAHHIRVRHSDFRCKLCNVPFSSFHALTVHNRRKHEVDTSERNYCVECDMQFANSLLYNEHVKRSSKHGTKPRVQCPGCEKTYSKRCYMTNHYNLVHLEESKYVCPVCDRRFLNGYRLRYHLKYLHEKQPKPKNHMCTYCGRGFNTRRILENHIRTHTGERPFACTHCSAAFAQLTALKTHMRSAHK